MRLHEARVHEVKVREVAAEDGPALLDAARHYLKMSGDEFAAAWEAGSFDDDPDPTRGDGCRHASPVWQVGHRPRRSRPSSVPAVHVGDPKGPVVGLYLVMAFAPLRLDALVAVAVALASVLAFDVHLAVTARRRWCSSPWSPGPFFFTMGRSCAVSRSSGRGWTSSWWSWRPLGRPTRRPRPSPSGQLARDGLGEARQAIEVLRGDALPGPERLPVLVDEHRRRQVPPVASPSTASPERSPARLGWRCTAPRRRRWPTFASTPRKAEELSCTGGAGTGDRTCSFIRRSSRPGGPPVGGGLG